MISRDSIPYYTVSRSDSFNKRDSIPSYSELKLSVASKSSVFGTGDYGAPEF